MGRSVDSVPVPPVVVADGSAIERLLRMMRSRLDCEAVVLGSEIAPGLPECGATDVPLLRPNGQYGGRVRLTPRGDGAMVDPEAVLELLGSLMAAGLHDVERRSLHPTQLMSSLRSTLEARDVDIVYQPIVALDTGEVVGLEALSRFPQSPPISPQRWFAEAAAAGLGDQLEALAVGEAVRILEELPHGIYLSVNVSPRALLSPEVAAVLEQVPADRLVIEITEHSQVDDYEMLNAALQPLRSRGARVAIDDTGSGFANMRHVLRLSPEIIKLDSSLTKDIDNDSVLRALGFTLRSFAAAIGAQMIAEGIETLQELDALRFVGVAYGQGYYLERPGELDAGEWTARGEVISSRIA